MKVYQELELRLEDISIDNILNKIDTLLPSFWIRDSEREDELTEMNHDVKQYAYSIVNNPGFPDASLWLANNDKGGLYVSNIVPCKVGKLTIEEYNSIMISFVDVLKRDPTIHFQLTKADMSLEDFMPKDVSEKLIRFSNNANKSTGYSHPCDFDRWLDFVISLHQCKCKQRLDLVERWLHEEAGWLWETASELCSQLEYSLNILQRYDELKR